MLAHAQDIHVSTQRVIAGTLGVVLCHFIAVATLSLVSAGIVGRYVVFYEKWQLVLPDLTLFFVNLSPWMSAYWYLLVLGLVPDGIVYFRLARLRPTRNWLAAVWAVMPLVFTIVTLGLITVTMYVPLQQLSPSQHAAAGERFAAAWCDPSEDGRLPDKADL